MKHVLEEFCGTWWHGQGAAVGAYHCSRYNTQTRRLTPEMFEAVFAAIGTHLRS